jgi:hypothetical protein
VYETNVFGIGTTHSIKFTLMVLVPSPKLALKTAFLDSFMFQHWTPTRIPLLVSFAARLVVRRLSVKSFPTLPLFVPVPCTVRKIVSWTELEVSARDPHQLSFVAIFICLANSILTMLDLYSWWRMAILGQRVQGQDSPCLCYWCCSSHGNLFDCWDHHW